MIYLITNQSSLKLDSLDYSYSTLVEMLEYFEKEDEISLDCETTGFDPYTTEMLSLQIGNFKDQFVIDTTTIDVRVLKEFIESKVLIGQNLKFDLKFLYRKGIYPMKIWDTFVVEKVIWCGYTTVRHGLDAITERYLNIKLDKSVRANIAKEGLTSRVIQYSADDVKYLSEIKTLQKKVLKEKDLADTVYLENRFTPVLAYIEYCGFKLDRAKWMHKMNLDNAKLVQCKQRLDQWILDNKIDKFISKQLDLFEPVSCSINWSSSKQVIPFFEYLGMNCEIVEKGVTKKSVEASNIAKYEKDFEIIKFYLEFKKAEKVVTTYGESFIKQINPVTKRLHTSFKQIMDTGRISSGGKDKITKESYINFQNIPADKETRACFVSEGGNTLLIADYSGKRKNVFV